MPSKTALSAFAPSERRRVGSCRNGSLASSTIASMSSGAPIALGETRMDLDRLIVVLLGAELVTLSLLWIDARVEAYRVRRRRP